MPTTTKTTPKRTTRWFRAWVERTAREQWGAVTIEWEADSPRAVRWNTGRRGHVGWGTAVTRDGYRQRFASSSTAPLPSLPGERGSTSLRPMGVARKAA